MARDLSQLDTTIRIVTPENIAFEYRVAGPFRRLPAFLVDQCICAAVFVAVTMMLFIGLSSAGGQTGFLMALGLSTLAYFVIYWFYGGLFETYMNGQTPGKWLLGIRVLTVDGRPINGLQAVMRNVLRLVDMMPLVPLDLAAELPPVYLLPTFILGLIAMSMNRRYQRLGDLVCGTVVVIEEKSWLMGVARIDDPRAPQLAEYLPPNYVVSRSMARTLAAYVERRRYFSQARRREIARHLGEPLLTQFELPADTSHDLLLCALYYRTFVADHGEGNAERPPAAQPPAAVAAPAPAGGDPGIVFVSPESVSKP